MRVNPTPRRLGLIGLAAVASLTVAACGSSSSSKPAATTAAPTTAAAAPATTAASSMTAMSFGAACSAVPADGAGSFAGMAMDPVATAASNNPVLSTLVTAVKAAGLVDTLNGAQNITVFAPVNDAFGKLDKATLDAALADPKGLLTKVLTYHVVGERITPEQLANGTFTTLQGTTLKTAGSGESFMVNESASVVCGNVQTANATVYLIDGVLMPAS